MRALSEDKRAALRSDIAVLLSDFDRGGDNGLVVPSDYLEVVIVKG